MRLKENESVCELHCIVSTCWCIGEGHLAVDEVSVSSTPNGIITAGGRAHY